MVESLKGETIKTKIVGLIARSLLRASSQMTLCGSRCQLLAASAAGGGSAPAASPAPSPSSTFEISVLL